MQSEINSFTLKFTANDPDFDRIYLDHHASLYRYAFTMLQDHTLAEEMVHQVFLKLLEKKEGVEIHTSLKAYLYRAVNHECLNYIKHQKVKQGFQLFSINAIEQYESDAQSKLQFKELEMQLKIAINNLPEQCRTIFQLSRFENLKYSEIATELGLSVKTVETQMSRALKKLRLQLADYLPLLIGFLINKIW